MKKIYSFFMALTLVLSATANSTFTVDKQLDFSNVKTSQIVKEMKNADATTMEAAKHVQLTQQEREAVAKMRQAEKPAMQVQGVRQQAPLGMERVALAGNTKRMAPAQAAEEIVAKDTVEFVAAVWNYQYYANTGDWWMAVADSAGTYRFDFDYVVPVENFAGTYSMM